MPTVAEIMVLFIEEQNQKVEIFDSASGETVFIGEYGDMPDEYQDCEIGTIDNVDEYHNHITFNVDLEEE